MVLDLVSFYRVFCADFFALAGQFLNIIFNVPHFHCAAKQFLQRVSNFIALSHNFMLNLPNKRPDSHLIALILAISTSKHQISTQNVTDQPYNFSLQLQKWPQNDKNSTHFVRFTLFSVWDGNKQSHTVLSYNNCIHNHTHTHTRTYISQHHLHSEFSPSYSNCPTRSIQ